MFAQFTPAIRGLVLDMDGVLWKDSSPIIDLPATFERMKSLGLKVMLATNNATLTVDQYVDKLSGFGVKLEPSQIVTSAHAAAHALSKAFPDKGAVFVVGENGIITALCDAGFKVITDPDDSTPAVAVVAGLDRALTYQKLSRAMWHIKAGGRFYGTNPDATFPTPQGPVPGAGSVIAAIQAAAATTPIVVGKPSPFMVQLCAERMGLSMQEILCVGDRLETDIAGAQGIGARSAFVLSGISTREQGEQWKPQPDLVAPNLQALVGA